MENYQRWKPVVKLFYYLSTVFLFKSGPSLASFCLFSSFQTNISIFITKKCEKSPSSIWWWDSNPWPLEHESPPITTRPGLPPLTIFLWTVVIEVDQKSFTKNSCRLFWRSRAAILKKLLLKMSKATMEEEAEQELDPNINIDSSGQSHKHFTPLNYDSRVIIWCIF